MKNFFLDSDVPQAITDALKEQTTLNSATLNPEELAFHVLNAVPITDSPFALPNAPMGLDGFVSVAEAAAGDEGKFLLLLGLAIREGTAILIHKETAAKLYTAMGDGDKAAIAQLFIEKILPGRYWMNYHLAEGLAEDIELSTTLRREMDEIATMLEELKQAIPAPVTGTENGATPASAVPENGTTDNGIATA